jgi:hypothetical protein
MEDSVENIIDHFGTAILAVMGALGIFAVYGTFLIPGGSIYDSVINFMVSICGR